MMPSNPRGKYRIRKYQSQKKPASVNLTQNATPRALDVFDASLDTNIDTNMNAYGMVCRNDPFPENNVHTTSTRLVDETTHTEFPPNDTGPYAHPSISPAVHVAADTHIYGTDSRGLSQIPFIPPPTPLQRSTHVHDGVAMPNMAGRTGMQMLMETDAGWPQVPNRQDLQPYPRPTANISTPQPPPDPRFAHQNLQGNLGSDVASTVDNYNYSNGLGTQTANTYWLIPKNSHPPNVNKRQRKNVPNIKNPHKIWQKQYKDADGNYCGTEMIFGSDQGPRGPSPKGTKSTTGACSRCRKLKKKCDRGDPDKNPYLPCTLCGESQPYILRILCSCYKMEDIFFFRDRPPRAGPLTQKREGIPRLDIQTSEKVWAVQITQGFGPELKVYVSRFTPISGTDVTSYRWKDSDGKICETERPPYCIVSLGPTKQNMLEYINYSVAKYIELLGGTGLTGAIFKEAMGYARQNKGTMVSDALLIWSVGRMIEEDWSFCISDADKFDIPPIPQDGSPWSGKNPVTPMMDTQLDQFIIHNFLISPRLRLLKKLKERILARNPKDWFEVFLTSFILLTNTENLGRHADRFRRRHGVLREGNIPRGMAKFFHGAKILLASFQRHYKGSAPFRADWQNPYTAKENNLNEEQVKFMQYIQGEISRQKNYMEGMKDQKLHTYKQHLYWSHQLFFDNWNPDSY